MKASRWHVWELVGDSRVVCARPGYASESDALDRVPLTGVSVVTRNGAVIRTSIGATEAQRELLSAYAAEHWIRLSPRELRPRLARAVRLRLAREAPVISRVPMVPAPRCTHVSRVGRPCSKARSALVAFDDPETATLCKHHRAEHERRAELRDRATETTWTLNIEDDTNEPYDQD